VLCLCLEHCILLYSVIACAILVGLKGIEDYPQTDLVIEPNVLLTRTRHRSSIELKDNTVIIVLGASGDLAKKKTVCSNAPIGEIQQR